MQAGITWTADMMSTDYNSLRARQLSISVKITKKLCYFGHVIWKLHKMDKVIH